MQDLSYSKPIVRGDMDLAAKNNSGSDLFEKLDVRLLSLYMLIYVNLS